MKVKDNQSWSLQMAEFSADESSIKFRDFLVLWVDTAEMVMQDGNSSKHPHDSLSKAFEVAEQSLGYLSVEWLGQMLLVIVQHWTHGDRVWDAMSVWERRMVEQATALKLVELQGSAQMGE
jgi:hypothetical protein